MQKEEKQMVLKRKITTGLKVKIFVTALITVLVGITPTSIQASTINLGEQKQGFIGEESYEWYYELNLKNYATGTRVKNMRSTNKKVAEVLRTSKTPQGAVTIKYNGLGKAILKWDVYKGKKHLATMKLKVRLIKCENPFKYFKVGKKNYVKEFSKSSQPNVAIFKTVKGKVKVKVKSDWKIKKIRFSASNKDSWSGATTIKNNKKITCNHKHNEVEVYAYNKKTKKTKLFCLFLNKY